MPSSRWTGLHRLIAINQDETYYSIRLPNIRVSFDLRMPFYWCSEAASISQFENFLHVNAVDHYTGLGEYLVGVADGAVEGN